VAVPLVGEAAVAPSGAHKGGLAALAVSFDERDLRPARSKPRTGVSRRACRLDRCPRVRSRLLVDKGFGSRRTRTRTSCSPIRPMVRASELRTPHASSSRCETTAWRLYAVSKDKLAMRSAGGNHRPRRLPIGSATAFEPPLPHEMVNRGALADGSSRSPGCSATIRPSSAAVSASEPRTS
jgi:hypothetical protein